MLVKDSSHVTITCVFGIVAAVLIFAVLSARGATAQDFEIPSVTISGGDLPNAVQLAPADADAFRRRVNQLPRFDDPPDVSGPRYVVTTSYWAVAVRLDEDEDEDALDVDVRADYYPNGGYVRVSVGEDDPVDAWMAVNLRQRSILDRYIALAVAGQIGETPSSVDVLAASSATEAFGVQAGDNVIGTETATELLRRLSEANPAPILEEREPPFVDESGFWLIVTLVEGRSHRYYYARGMLTEALGTERYDATSLGEVMESIVPPASQPIAQAKPAGSLLWWPVTIAGGVAAIGAAVWLQRKSAS